MELSLLVISPSSQSRVPNGMGALLVASKNAHSSNPRADAAMDRYASGDDTAFAELYDALAPRMYTFISRKVGNVARAEDLVQQTLLKLHCARGRYVAGSCVSPWAFAILRRLHLDQERRKKLEVLSPDGTDDEDVFWSMQFAGGLDEWPTRPGVKCFALTVAIAACPLLAFVLIRRSSDPKHPALTGFCYWSWGWRRGDAPDGPVVPRSFPPTPVTRSCLARRAARRRRDAAWSPLHSLARQADYGDTLSRVIRISVSRHTNHCDGRAVRRTRYARHGSEKHSEAVACRCEREKLMKSNRINHIGVLASICSSVALGCGGPASADEPAFDEVGAALSPKCAPEVDPSIAVPAGTKLAFALDALGSQVYVCQTSGSSYAWTLQAPDALLYKRGKKVGTQYTDGSLVIGTKVSAFTPDATTIPWLLLQATSHADKGKMDDVTFVQRLYTEGGLAPDAATCTADHVGEVTPTEYVATSYYFVPGKPPCGCK